ncbi:MAG: hypothetical protein ACOYOK_00125 [Pseudobdellovibrionaceae bacterium]
MKNKKHCEITDRDYKILRFVWKWKAVSTQALAQKFFPGVHAFSAYRRLLFLESDGYLGSYVVSGRFHEAWILKEKGFKYILPHLGDLDSQGFKSANYPHDFLATAFHLGDWLTQQPNNTQTYSEQQLRCYPSDLWPTWIPRSALHRPDGYSAYQSKEKRVVIAFEAEISPKAKKRYESVVTFYDNQPAIDYVFWLVDSKNTLNTLKRNFEKLQIREWSKHQFILHCDFIKNGWLAPFTEGQFQGRCLSDFLSHKTATMSSQSHLSCGTLALLDSRRRPIHSTTYPTKPNVLKA